MAAWELQLSYDTTCMSAADASLMPSGPLKLMEGVYNLLIVLKPAFHRTGHACLWYGELLFSMCVS